MRRVKERVHLVHVRAQLPIEPGLGRAPVAHHRNGGYLEDLRRLLHAESAEKPHFHHLHLSWTNSRQRVHRVIECHQVQFRRPRPSPLRCLMIRVEHHRRCFKLCRARSRTVIPPHHLEPKRQKSAPGPATAYARNRRAASKLRSPARWFANYGPAVLVSCASAPAGTVSHTQSASTGRAPRGLPRSKPAAAHSPQSASAELYAPNDSFPQPPPPTSMEGSI